MTRLYLDTEFNGHGGGLISMALVEELGGREWYEVLPLSWKRDFHPWVQENVLPVLGKSEIPTADFVASFHAFIRQFDNPEIICDWSADAEHFCRLLAAPDYARSLYFACRITILKTPLGQPVSRIPHNALADAQALCVWHEGRLSNAA